MKARTPEAVNVYTCPDGDVWGIWCEGHISPEIAMAKFNARLPKEGLLEVDDESLLDHAYARFEGDGSDYDFDIVDKETPGAIPITVVRGDYLEYKLS